MLTCFEVAEYFLSQVDENGENSISNLKLQKLVYYAQGVYLALYDEPLFAEKIVAGRHGPVVHDLYHKYKEYKCVAIPAPQIDRTKYPIEALEVLDEVFRYYGRLSAEELSSMTHNEPPWQRASTSQGEISHASLKNYFKENSLVPDPEKIWEEKFAATTDEQWHRLSEQVEASIREGRVYPMDFTGR